MQRRMIVIAAATASLIGAAAGPAYALRPLPTYEAVPLDSPVPQVGAWFGEHLGVVGDLDQDGVLDIGVSSTRQNTAAGQVIGRVWVFSGRTRALLRTFENPDPQVGKGFGDSIVGLDDVDADGTPDLAIAAAIQDVFTGPGTPCGTPEPNGCKEDQGRVYVFSGASGSVIRQIAAPTPQEFAFFGFGFGMATGDLDGDGVGDFVETSEGENIGVCDDDGDPATPPTTCPFVGAAYAFSGRTGALIHRFDDPEPPEAFASFGGGGVTNPGDVTGDGVDDITIGAAFSHGGRGAGFLFNGKTGALVRTIDSPIPAGQDGGFGFGAGSGGIEPGDVDGDGVRDLIFAAPGQDVAGVDNAGMVYLISGADGSVIRTLQDPNPLGSGSLGALHAGAGDVNGDGTDDVLAGRFVFPDPTLPGGAMYVFDGRTGATLVTLPGMTAEGPGSDIASPGDVNGDGYPDYFLGGRLLDVGDPTEEKGRVIVELSQAPAGAAAVAAPEQGSPPSTPAAPTVVSRAGVRLTARVSPRRDRRAPYRFTVSGRVVRAAGITQSACAGGRVSVQWKTIRGKTVSTRRAALSTRCTFSSRVTFRARRRLAGGRLKVAIRFLGNDRLRRTAAKVLTARAG